MGGGSELKTRGAGAKVSGGPKPFFFFFGKILLAKFFFFLGPGSLSLLPGFVPISNACNKVELMAVIMRYIWFRRNQLRVSNKDHPISQVIPTSQQALMDYQQASNV